MLWYGPKCLWSVPGTTTAGPNERPGNPPSSTPTLIPPERGAGDPEAARVGEKKRKMGAGGGDRDQTPTVLYEVRGGRSRSANSVLGFL